MQSRGARIALVVILLAIAAAAGFHVWRLQTALLLSSDADRQIGDRVEGLISTASGLLTFQTAYVALGQPRQRSVTRTAALLQQFTSDLSALESSLRSTEARALAATLHGDAQRLAAVDERLRLALESGDELLASELTSTEAEQISRETIASLRELRRAELDDQALSRLRRTREAAIVALGSIGAWTIGLLLLLPRGRLESPPIVVAAAESPGAKPAAAPPSIDLTAAADLCVAISRVTTAAALPALLARAATLLDSPGMIVWMSAGEELFAAAAHGYDNKFLGRLGPIGRRADNATAAAWRLGEVRIVPGDAASNGAIVAPMFGPDACIGVLAVEVRQRREQDISTRAVTAMIAAQLGTIVDAWPAASTPVTPPASAQMTQLKTATGNG